MSQTTHTKCLIIGSGPAGYTAGVYAARAMLEPVLVQGIEPGGQLTTTTEVENWPGDTEVQGPDLMVRMEAHAKAMGCAIVGDIITDLDTESRPFVAKGDSGATYTADAVILATGARAKWLGLESEEAFKGFGVSACATCDGFFYRGQEIVVIGGGMTAIDAAVQSKLLGAENVTLVYRRTQDKMPASEYEQHLAQSKGVHIMSSVAPVALKGEGHVAAIELAYTDENAKPTGETFTLPADQVFKAIGQVFEAVEGLDLDGRKIAVTGAGRTSRKGVWAGGDCTAGEDLTVVAVSEGRDAAEDIHASLMG